MSILNKDELLAGGFEEALTDIGIVRPRKRAVILVMGQSIHQGPIPLSDKSTYPQSFYSQRNPSFVQKRIVPVASRGSYWPKVYDIMWDYGYELDIYNAAVGGVSLVLEITGYTSARSNNSALYQKREHANYPDLGDWGSIVVISGRHFVCTTGRKRQLWNMTPHLMVTQTTSIQDFISYGQTSEATSGSAPDVSSVPIGGTVQDGTVTLTRIDSAFYVDDSPFKPGNDGTLPNRSWGGFLGESAAGFGFDPLGIIAAADRLANQAGPTDIRIMDFSHGQSDLGTSVEGYKRASMILANFFLRRGWHVVLGNTTYSPASANSTTGYANQVAGIDNAITDLNAFYPTHIHRGANLYERLGNTGNMGGAQVTGTVSGTTLTVTSVATGRGSGVAIGQRVWNGSTLIGTISALGTGSGGTGTYTLDSSASLGSTTLICAGNWLQYDGIHINGAAVDACAEAIADSYKVFLL